jgi:hypothetical protein
MNGFSRTRDHHFLEQTLMVRVEDFLTLKYLLIEAIRPFERRFTLKTPGRPRKEYLPLSSRALAATPGPWTVTVTGPTRVQLKTNLTCALGAAAAAGADPRAVMTRPVASAPARTERRTIRNTMILSWRTGAP